MRVKTVNVFGCELNEEIEVFPFCMEQLELVPDDAIYGNYRIGLIDDNNHFLVRYYGRSDKNNEMLKGRISNHIGEVTNREQRIYDSSYYFWFQTVNTAIDAYKQECRDYHSFGTHQVDEFVDNEIHPDKPDGMQHLHCPVCYD